MNISIYNGAASVRLALPASFKKSAMSSGSFGSGQFMLPRSSSAWRDDLLRRDGGQLVRMRDGSSTFTGIAREPVWTDDGATIRVIDICEWVGQRELRRKRTFRACPAAIIARRAIEDAFVGSAVLPVTLGKCAIGAPLIPSYEFSGKQTVQQVLAHLQDETGQEWTIDHETYEFRWQAEIGRYREGLIVDMGELFPKFQGRSLTERYQQTTEIDQRTRRSFTAQNMSMPPLWPSQKTIEV